MPQEVNIELGNEEDDKSDLESNHMSESDASQSDSGGPDVDAIVEDLPSAGYRLGIIALDRAPTAAAKCWVCSELGDAEPKIGKGVFRFWWRSFATRAERSTHTHCVIGLRFTKLPAKHWTRKHQAHSVQLLRDELATHIAAHESVDLLKSAYGVLSSFKFPP